MRIHVFVLLLTLPLMAACIVCALWSVCIAGAHSAAHVPGPLPAASDAAAARNGPALAVGGISRVLPVVWGRAAEIPARS